MLPHSTKYLNNTRKYQELKQEVYAKTGGHCAYCGVAIHPYSFHADHITPQSLDGETTLDNLNPCCGSCNSMKGGRSLEDLRLSLGRKAIGVPHFSVTQRDWLKSVHGLDVYPTDYVFWIDR